MTANTGFIEKLRDIVLKHYTDEQFGVSELVERYGMSRSQLHRKLKSATGQSISQFIREIRLDEALKLLQQEDVTASEVSYKVGFNSPTYFNTCFNEYFGYPPGEVKHQVALGNLGRLAGSEQKSGSKNRSLLVWLALIVIVAGGFLFYKFSGSTSSDGGQPNVTTPKTIAVLPFKNWSGDPNLEYVSDGMTDAVITRLSRISDIEKVVPFSTVIGFKNSDKLASEIAKELNVAFILEGNFKLSGNQVMSNLNLIEISTNEFIWSLEYSGTWNANEIFEMQAAIAENVVENMKAKISTIEKAQVNHALTNSLEAYQAYLRGDAEYYRLDETGFVKAIDWYSKAIQLDTTFVEAYLGLGRTHVLSGLVWGIKPQDEAWAVAEPLFQKALLLDRKKKGYYENYIESTMVTAYFYFEIDIKKAENWYQKMVHSQTDMSYTDFFFDYTRKTGRFDVTMDILDGEIKRYPVLSDAYWQKGLIHIMKGENEEALDLLESNDEYYKDNFFYLQETAKWYYYIGAWDRSKINLQRILTKHKDRPPIINWLIAVHADMEDDRSLVQFSLNALRDQHESRASGSPAWFIALYYCHKQDYDKAFEWLNISFQNSEVELTWFMEEPLLKPLKSDPRYIALYNKLGFDAVEPLPRVD